MQAQIVIRQGWQALFKSQAVGLAFLAVATLVLTGLGLYALSSSNHAAAAPRVVSVTDQRPNGATRLPEHGNLAGGAAESTDGTGSQGPTYGQLLP